MKKVLIIFWQMLFYISNSQSLQKEFESKKWYVTGTFFDQNPLVLKSSDFKDKDSDIEFIKGRLIKWHEITKESSFDMEGNEVGPGIEHTDTTFSYTFKNNMIKMMRYLPAVPKHHDEIRFYLYYKIETLEDKKVYQLNHITYEEFNK